MSNHRTITRSTVCWAFLFAAYLGLAHLAIAQDLQVGANVRITSPYGGHRGERRSEDGADINLAAINGELACLGDPLILRCGVEVVVNGQTLEARGRVRSEAIRAHVLKVASE